MIFGLSKSVDHYDETTSTLRFAMSAKLLKTSPKLMLVRSRFKPKDLDPVSDPLLAEHAQQIPDMLHRGGYGRVEWTKLRNMWGFDQARPF